MGVIQMLSLKASTRMRREGFGAHAVQLSLLYGDGTWFRKHRRAETAAWTVADVFRNGLPLFNSQRGGDGRNNAKGVSKVMVDLYDLQAGASA